MSPITLNALVYPVSPPKKTLCFGPAKAQDAHSVVLRVIDLPEKWRAWVQVSVSFPS
ncbi:Uncharacterised protein [Mycobacteroides abscessus subsp. abscessus]|nr:Uncharacterised protein [Mycobacteroides abscessus subsp. abscessus]SKT82162.1 Uncharacterised protein [Mycobacteroides abscessus subsp. abscessus]